MDGSSPHTRGAPASNLQQSMGAGIIPAYAGSTPTPTWSKKAFWDHPRIRGEHVAAREPQLRGHRIIPAYAGSTKDCPTGVMSCLDHPRIRGEHRSTGLTWPSQ